MQFQIPQPHNPIGGATVKQGQNTNKPIPLGNRIPFHRPTSLYSAALDGPTVIATPFVPFNISQPIINYYRIDSSLYQDKIIKRFEGATIQRTDPIPGISQPQFNYYKPETNRYQNEVIKRVEGATNQQTYVFPLAQYEGRYYTRNTFAETKLPILGVTAAPNQTYIFPLSNPDFRYYARDINRYNAENIGPTIQVTGATNQQMYAFQLDQSQSYRYIRSISYDYSATKFIQIPTGTSTTKNYYTGNWANNKRMSRGLGF